MYLELFSTGCTSGCPAVRAGEGSRDDVQHREPRPVSTAHRHLQQLLQTGHFGHQDGIHSAADSAHGGMSHAHSMQVTQFRHQQERFQTAAMHGKEYQRFHTRMMRVMAAPGGRPLRRSRGARSSRRWPPAAAGTPAAARTSGAAPSCTAYTHTEATWANTHRT